MKVVRLCGSSFCFKIPWLSSSSTLIVGIGVLGKIYWNSRKSVKRVSDALTSGTDSIIVINDTTTKSKKRKNKIIVVTDGESQPRGYEETQRVLEFDDSDLNTPIARFKKKKTGSMHKTSVKRRNQKEKRPASIDMPESSSAKDTSKRGKLRKRKNAPTTEATVENELGRKRKKSKRDEFPTLKTRSSPFQLVRCMSLLSLEQQLAVKNMGFGRLLNFRMDGVPLKLAHYVVDNFDPERIEINAPCGSMKINRKVVQKLLGIPRGSVKLLTIERKTSMEKAVKRWRKRYKSKFVSAKSMVDKIESSDGADTFDFRMDFLMCFVTVMIDCHKQGTLREWILYHISKKMQFNNIDWCGLLVDHLRECMMNWDRSDPGSPFTGPLATLTLLYVGRVTCPGMDVDYSLYPMAYWTAKRLKDREKLEIQNGGFGKGCLKCLSVTWERDDQPTAQDRMHVVGKNMDEILKYKKRVEDMLGVLCEEQPDDVEVQSLKARYASLLNDQPLWIRELNATEQIKAVVGSLNEESDDSAGGQSSASLGDAGCASPEVSLYRKSMRKTRSAQYHDQQPAPVGEPGTGSENMDSENDESGDAGVVVSQYQRSLTKNVSKKVGAEGSKPTRKTKGKGAVVRGKRLSKAVSPKDGAKANKPRRNTTAKGASVSGAEGNVIRRKSARLRVHVKEQEDEVSDGAEPTGKQDGVEPIFNNTVDGVILKGIGTDVTNTADGVQKQETETRSLPTEVVETCVNKTAKKQESEAHESLAGSTGVGLEGVEMDVKKTADKGLKPGSDGATEKEESTAAPGIYVALATTFEKNATVVETDKPRLHEVLNKPKSDELGVNEHCTGSEGVGKDTTATRQDVGNASDQLADQTTTVAPEDLKVTEKSSSAPALGSGITTL